MNTMFLLMAEFETTTILLSDVSEKYLGMRPSTADKKAILGELPFPTFRVGVGQKSPRVIHVNDLAEYIDLKRKEAKEDLLRIK
ncbi:pyocin activator protein PrtN [Rosenbergiella sp. S61]|uniref:Pyocin activator protein PrtN n=1 Tax=Rosenbergiella gaditana TaxID=2726987 RepID=A0ABS5SYD4_9GAMM|nr:pyocin activator PrtN family protein [Rosenbergiella gaditana]MBT0725110.1 pyocin activator protein PrtN [Rosenbergiella gaditana]